ncbi:MAG: 4-hydroxy-3-methylbut-2-enyl diphosphate reductase [Candidatus Tokpelaia sp. JSC161]|jgi:4-hydroxy-3-methylbut-2-enyl diphosphate reductase|nr:MAG: 4-hydroxy-3-methylbut-2-enyl diphosphate reductase [Candidatus Tokpelaia sp. JSC161]
MAAKLPLTIRLCRPRGFCAGVDRSIQIVVAALKKYGSPVYVRHQIVHNRYVVQGLIARGAVFIEELIEIPHDKKDRPVIFSAHGVPRTVMEDAKNKKLFYIDATCPLVSKIHKQAIRHFRKERHVILIGHSGHPEVIGTMGQLSSENITLIETIEDALSYHPQDPSRLGFVTQTTLSLEDTKSILHILKKRFPFIKAPATESICYATTNRQNVVKAAAPGSDLFLIVGASNSSNSCRLVEVAQRAGASCAFLIQSPDEINWRNLGPLRTVGLSAGASAPEIIVSDIIQAFIQRYNVSIELQETVEEHQRFPIHRELSDVILNKTEMAFVHGHEEHNL